MEKKTKGAAAKISYNDNPVIDPKDDRLGFGKYCIPTLVNVIEECGMPYVIGIYGPWGCGKTSLMRLTQEKLEEKGHETIWINPWKYSRTEDVRKALVRSVYGQLRTGLQIKTLLKKEHRKETVKKALKAAVDIASRAAMAGEVSSEIEQLFFLDPIFKDTFQEEFTSLLSKFLKKSKRLVIFIDDLDRCVPEVVIDIFEAIKLYLDVPRCVFVVGASPDIIEKGVFYRYREYFLKEEKAVVQSEKAEGGNAEGREHPLMTGREYMEKIIQLPFPVPEPELEDIENFIADNAKRVGLKEDYKDWKRHLVDIVIATAESNPRNIKRLLASIHMSYMMAQAKAMKLEPEQLMKLSKVCAMTFRLSDEELRALWVCPDLAWPRRDVEARGVENEKQ